MTIKCIAIDDEPAALDLLVSYIEQTPFLELKGRFDNAIAALKETHNKDIALIFLDINMPDLNGLELARILDQSENGRTIRVIFTTAYEQYALEGFRVKALDYLLKPFNYVDFSRAATRANEFFTLIANVDRPDMNQPAAIGSTRQYFYLKVEHQLVRVDFADILYIEGLKDYIKLYLKSKDRPLITHSSLKKIADKIPSGDFLRLHRSYIVSTEAIRSATKTSVMVGTTTIYVSEQYKDAFNEFLNKRTL